MPSQNDTIFQKIVSMLQTLPGFIDDNNVSKVYDSSEIVPVGYPCAYVMYDRTESVELSNNADKVKYFYIIKVFQETISDNFGQAKAEQVSRDREYEISQLFRNHITLQGLGGVLRALPIQTIKNYSEKNTNIMLTITLSVDTVEGVGV